MKSKTNQLEKQTYTMPITSHKNYLKKSRQLSFAIVEVKVFNKWAKRGSMSSMPVSST